MTGEVPVEGIVFKCVFGNSGILSVIWHQIGEISSFKILSRLAVRFFFNKCKHMIYFNTRNNNKVTRNISKKLF